MQTILNYVFTDCVPCMYIIVVLQDVSENNNPFHDRKGMEKRTSWGFIVHIVLLYIYSSTYVSFSPKRFHPNQTSFSLVHFLSKN